jgi:hypothetical protein
VVIAGALGKCVHVAVVMNFLRLAEAAGWQSVFLGPAVRIEQVLAAAREHNASLVGVSERAHAIGFFEQIFDGSEAPEDVLAYLRDATRAAIEVIYLQTAVERFA